MRERAKSQQETRRRIVEATMHLHEEIGPRATTISAIAERAGVQRLTVYRHFPDENAVFQACTSHWLELNPPPKPESWNSIQDARQRLRRALSAFCAYYAATRGMWAVSHRDVDDVPALQGPMEEFERYVDSVGDDLARAFGASGAAQGKIAATIQHALSFIAWEDLDSRGLNDRAKEELVVSWVSGICDEHRHDARTP